MASQNETNRTNCYLAASAELVEGREGFQWRVSECPLCGLEHWHGAAGLTEDPRTYLSHRVAHCIKRPSAEIVAALEILNCDSSGYILVDEDPRRTDAMWTGPETEDAEVAR